LRVGVLHDSLNFAGGAERVCLKTIEALKEEGYEVVLGTIEPTDWGALLETMGWKRRPDREISLLGFGSKTLRIYMSMLAPIILSRLRTECDLCVGTNGDLMPLDTDVTYMHYLPISLSSRFAAGQEFSNLLAIYTLPFRTLQESTLKKLRRDSVVANSLFSRDAIRARLGCESKVLYPPVELETFSSVRGSASRDNAVVACGRFSPEKNFEFVLEVAGLLPQIDFVILGTLSGALSRSYYEKLHRIKEGNKLRNVRIVRSTFAIMLSVYSSSKLFLSATVEEAFGLSVAESMASGLVPVVHRSGGPWQDILGRQEGRYGFSFSSARDAASTIERLMGDERGRQEIVLRNGEGVQRFSSVLFKEGMCKIVQDRANSRPVKRLWASEV
jgi:alpha-1,2-mannosyltransferase